jgi:hypothetical protein
MPMAFRGDHAKKECIHCQKVEARADVRQERAIADVAAAGWDTTAPRTEQLNDEDIGPILLIVETGQRPEWNSSPTAAPRTKATGPMDIPRRQEQHTRASLGIHRWTIKNSPNNSTSKQSERRAGHKTLNKVRQRCYCLQARNDIEKWCRQRDTCAASRGPETRKGPNVSVQRWGPV